MKISIGMITYNHEEFIAQAIESVVMQETTYEFELIIGEDCSTDNTRQICEDYQKQYPDKIRLLSSESGNLGAMRNYIRTLKVCDGEFLATIEGDDYWITTDKLQMQADFLVNNPDYVGCFTDYNVIETGEASAKAVDHIISLKGDTLSLHELLRGNQIMTCTVLYRNKIREYNLDWMASLKLGDWPTHMIHAQYGDFKYLPIKTGVYRLHHSNYYAGRPFKERTLAEQDVLNAMKAHLNVSYHPRIQQVLRWRYITLAELAYKQSDWIEMLRYLIKALQHKSLSSWLKTLRLA